MVYARCSYQPSLSSWDFDIMSLLSKFSKSAPLFEILSWYCSPKCTFFRVLRLNESMSGVSAGHLLTDKTLPKFCNHQIVTSITLTSYERLDSKYSWMTSSVYCELINLIVRFTSEVQVCLRMLWCMYKRIRFLKWQSLLLKHHYH